VPPKLDARTSSATSGLFSRDRSLGSILRELKRAKGYEPLAQPGKAKRNKDSRGFSPMVEEDPRHRQKLERAKGYEPSA